MTQSMVMVMPEFTLSRENVDVQTIAVFTIPGEPVSKSRARFTKLGHAYTPEKTKAAEEMVAWKFRAATAGHQIDATGSFGVFGIFYAGTRQRRDVDNMIKLICDGLTGIAWADDSQVAEVSGRRGHDAPANARTEVWIYRLGELPSPPMAACLRCGTEFRTYASWATRPGGKKYCTPECFYESVKERRTGTCKHCSAEFLNPTSHPRVYCSEDCDKAARTVQWDCVQCGKTVTMPKSKKPKHLLCEDLDCRRAYWGPKRKRAAQGTCATCGGPTSKKTYTNCHVCSHAAKPKATT